MKAIALLLLVLLAWLQYKIWLQDGGIPEVLQLEAEVELRKQEVDTLRERNASLDAEVRDLKKGLDAIEERARSEMGMIRDDEVYYQVVERQSSGSRDPEQNTATRPEPTGTESSQARQASVTTTGQVSTDKDAAGPSTMTGSKPVLKDGAELEDESGANAGTKAGQQPEQPARLEIGDNLIKR